MTRAPDHRAASYRALLGVPWLARALLGMQIARIGQSMLGLALVLFSLNRYHAPELAGLVTFASLAPGILVSPIAGALLDRHGRTRLIVLDFIVAAIALGLIGALGLADALPAWLLAVIAAVTALTGPLSAAGLRSLFPLMAPRHLWERMNAVDANGYVVAQIIGPPIAAGLVATVGSWAFIVLGVVHAVAALIIARVPDPETASTSSGRLLVDAWQGVVYTFRNRTLRGLGISISIDNIGAGIVSIAIPLIVTRRLGLDETAVGMLYAVQGVFGMVAGVLAGRLDTRGRERNLIAWPILASVATVALLLPSWGLVPVVISMALYGLLSGPLDVALFTVRQRRTDPIWMGRAFAVSMMLNFSGFPIGSAVGGFLAGVSIDVAVGAAVVFTLVGGLLALWLIPRRAPEPGVERARGLEK